MGLISQLITTLFTFLTRNLFIKYIGVELLGLNSTFTSVLSTLSLAELGFQGAITYSLYKPLSTKNEDEINDIMNILKIIYRVIGFVFIIASFLALPFLKYIISGMEIQPILYVYFLLQAASSTCTYFLAYKRAILYADEKDYIAKLIDMILNILFSFVQCISLVLVKSYAIYLILKILQVYISNIVVHSYCAKHYPYLHGGKLNWTKLKEIWSNVKNIFASKVASYIYTSTDNLVISAFVSTVSVGYLANYTTVIRSMKLLTTSVLNPMIPIIGNYLVDDENGRSREKAFLLYTHARFLIAMIIVVPIAVLIDIFVSIWIGEDMLLPTIITILLAVDFYIDIVHSATVDFINGSGLFKSDKYIEIAGAICNIVISVILVENMGIVGVLIGTVISQVVLWIGRSFIVYHQCMKLRKSSYIKYWGRNIVYIISFGVVYFICWWVLKRFSFQNLIMKFVFGGIVTEIIIALYVVLVFKNIEEQKQIIGIVKGILKKDKRVRG